MLPETEEPQSGGDELVSLKSAADSSQEGLGQRLVFSRCPTGLFMLFVGVRVVKNYYFPTVPRRQRVFFSVGMSADIRRHGS